MKTEWDTSSITFQKQKKRSVLNSKYSVETSPKNVTFQFGLCRCYPKTGKLDIAAKRARQCCKLDTIFQFFNEMTSEPLQKYDGMLQYLDRRFVDFVGGLPQKVYAEAAIAHTHTDQQIAL